MKAVKQILLYMLVPVIFTGVIYGCAYVYLTNNQMFMGYIANIQIVLPPETSEPKSIRPEQEIPVDIEEEVNDGNIKASEIIYPVMGQQYGIFLIPDLDLEEKMFFGDSNTELGQGVGHSPYSYFPGEGGKILVAGHNRTSFAPLENIKEGMEVTLKTTYGTFIYKVTRISTMAAVSFDGNYLDDSKEELIFYTCYPFHALPGTKYRLFVFAEKISGPSVSISE